MPLPPTATSQDWFQLGHRLRQETRPEPAYHAFLRAHELAPDDINAARAAATLADGLKLPRRALAILSSLAAVGKADADVLAMMASLHLELGQPEAALALCDRVLARSRSHRNALANRGVALRSLGRVADAVENDRRLTRAYVGSADAWQRLADACLMGGRYPEALAAAERALTLQPGLEPARSARALALAMLERFDEADAEFHHPDRESGVAKEGDATLPLDARGVYLARWLQHQSICDWARRAELLAVLRREFAPGGGRCLQDKSIAFNILALPLSAPEQQAVARAVAGVITDRAPQRTIPLAKRRRNRLRIGYLSADYRPHPVAENFWRVFPLHDRARFEVFAYSLTPDDGSPQRARVVANADGFVDLSRLSDREAVERIALDQLHILVDRSCYTDFTRPELLAARVAPIQVQDLGMAGPSGAHFIDYRFSDAFVTPPEVAPFWDEALALLPDTLFLCDDTVAVPSPPTRAECGLPEDAFVYCCFNNHFKIEPDVFSSWMRLLALIPHAVLWLIDAGGASVAHLRAEAARRGVDPGRLIFAPRQPLDRHLARHACADLFLDTFYYGAHTTAVDALRAGLPVLTCAGQTMAARIGGSLLHAVGLPELVTTNARDYEALALRLAMRDEELATLRRRLRECAASSALFATPRRVRDMERAFEIMWRRHEHGEAPTLLDLTREVP